MQRQLDGMLGSMQPPVLLPEHEIAGCKTFRAALGHCMQVSRVKRSQGDLARSVGIHPTQFSKILHGAKGQHWHLDPEKIAKIEALCGNHAMTQWLAANANLLVVQDSEEARQRRAMERRIKQLEGELAQRAAA